MSLEQSGSQPEFAAEFPPSQTGGFAAEFPSDGGEMMMNAPEPVMDPTPVADQGDFQQAPDMFAQQVPAPDGDMIQGDMMGMQQQGSGNDFGSQGDFTQNDVPQGDRMGSMMGGDDFADGGQQMAPPADDFFTEAPQQASMEPMQPMEPAAPAIDDSTMREWKEKHAIAIVEKRTAEERELKQIREEAQAERELLYSQREKQIAAAKTANREREVVMEASRGEGWEAVCSLISYENLVKDKNTDLSRFKQTLIKLKHQKPMTAM